MGGLICTGQDTGGHGEVRDESAGMERQSIEKEQIESEVHTVPLKVIGSCHSGERQKILEEAFEYL